MNLSFSTRGWNSLSWEEQLRDAVEMNFQGIEPYNIQEFPSLSGRGGAFHAYRQNETMREMKKNRLTIPCFDTSIDLSLPLESTEKTDYLFQTAAAMRVQYVAFCALRDQEEVVRSNLSGLLPAAQAEGVCILLKTVGIYADTGRLRELMDSYACDELAALWDMHHPYRDFQVPL